MTVCKAVRRLADYVIARHYPEAEADERPYLALLHSVIARQARLIAQWLGVGFIHGVMNTDNVSIAGETIDYGPCAFMDAYHPATVYSSIDRGGRYAYHRQPAILHWNLARLAETLLPLLGEDDEARMAQAHEALDAFAPRFQAAWSEGLRSKIGLAEAREGDDELAGGLLECMADQRADFTSVFRRLCDVSAADPSTDAGVRALFEAPAAFDAWAQRWRTRLAAEDSRDEVRRTAMRAVNPAFIPRNHRVEQAIEAATAGDVGPFDALLAAVTRPYEDQPEHASLTTPPEPHEIVRQTFCGT